jgi:predicted CopG family antitoxin
MGFRNVSLSDDAYERLSAMRRPGESFSDVVRRLTRGRSLTELSGLLSKAEADSLAAAVTENRKARLRRKKERLGLR